MSTGQGDTGWADDVDYGDDDDEQDNDDGDAGIGDLDLSDDDDDEDLPPNEALAGPSANDFKSEVTSTLQNPNKVGVSFQLQLDAKETPADISDDDETAPGLKINHFQLIASAQPDPSSEHKSDDTIIGTGAFAKVFRARNTKNGRTVALKCMYKNLLRKQFLMKSRYNMDDDDDAAPQMLRHTMLDAVQIELQIMMKIRHINVLRLLYVIDDPGQDLLYLALEFSPFGQVMDFDGKLLQYVPNQKITPLEKYVLCDRNVAQPWWYHKYVWKQQSESAPPLETVQRFTEDVSRKLFMDCVQGMQFLHSLNIIHRDLKPENLLLFADDVHESGLMVKIADFGTAEQFNSKQEAFLIDTQGTYHFMSPSAIGGEKRNAFHDDLWSLGVILYAFTFGTVPFFHPLDYQLFESIQNDALVMPENEVLSASDELRDLIEQLLVKEDEKRISLSEIIEHAWYRKVSYTHPTYVMPEDDDVDSDGDVNIHQEQDCCLIL